LLRLTAIEQKGSRLDTVEDKASELDEVEQKGSRLDSSSPDGSPSRLGSDEQHIPAVPDDTIFCTPVEATVHSSHHHEEENVDKDGIISYLSNKHGGNVHTKPIVKITSKSTCGPKHEPQNVADLISAKFFKSKTKPGQWIRWKFRVTPVCLTGYRLSARFLQSWVLEGSQDKKHWTELDRQKGNQVFKSEKPQTASFTISNRSKCRFIRLTQIDKNHAPKSEDRNRLILSSVEFIGEIFE
jgi:hypothetical protein